MNVRMCVYVLCVLYIYIYIYIYRERERERESTNKKHDTLEILQRLELVKTSVDFS
jgi:hypothetical protein